MDDDISASHAVLMFSVAETQCSFTLEKNEFGFRLCPFRKTQRTESPFPKECCSFSSSPSMPSTDILHQGSKEDGPTLGELMNWMRDTGQFDYAFNWRFSNGRHFVNELSFFFGGGWTGHILWLLVASRILHSVSSSKLVTWIFSILMFPIRCLDEIVMPGRLRRLNQSYANKGWSRHLVYRESRGQGLQRKPGDNEVFDDTIVNLRIFKEPLGVRAMAAGPSYHSIVTFSTISDLKLGLAYAMEKYDTGVYLTIFAGTVKQYLKRRRRAATAEQYLAFFDPSAELEHEENDDQEGREWITNKRIKDVMYWLELTKQCDVGYHWRYANCQHFAEELCQFITGWSPPSFIRSLFPNILNGVRARLSSWSREALMYWIDRYSFGWIRPYSISQERLLDWIYRVEPMVVQTKSLGTNAMDPLEEITSWLPVGDGVASISDSAIEDEESNCTEYRFLRWNALSLLTGFLASLMVFGIRGWQGGWQLDLYSGLKELLLPFLVTVGISHLGMLLFRRLRKPPEIQPREEIQKFLNMMTLQMIRDVPDSPEEFFEELSMLLSSDKDELPDLLKKRGGRIHVAQKPVAPFQPSD